MARGIRAFEPGGLGFAEQNFKCSKPGEVKSEAEQEGLRRLNPEGLVSLGETSNALNRGAEEVRARSGWNMQFLLPPDQGTMQFLLRYAIPATTSKLCDSCELCGSCHAAIDETNVGAEPENPGCHN